MNDKVRKTKNLRIYRFIQAGPNQAVRGRNGTLDPVDAEDLAAGRDKSSSQGAADISGSACNHDLHRAAPKSLIRQSTTRMAFAMRVKVWFLAGKTGKTEASATYTR